MKVCNSCDIEKPFDDFYRHSETSDGVSSSCKECTKARSKVRYELNRDILSKQAAARYRKNVDAIKERVKRYRSENPDKVQVWREDWMRSNPEKLREIRSADSRSKRARRRQLPSEAVTVRQIALRDGAHCWLCGDELSDFDPSHMDHLIPLSAKSELLAVWGIENPGTVVANMALACPPCNIRKSNKILPCAIARYLRNSEPLEAIA